MTSALKKRPLAGSATGRVWSTADMLVEKLGRLPTGREVVDAYLAGFPDGNEGTGFTQYSHWKKAHLAHFERGARPKMRGDGAYAVSIGPDGRLVVPASLREALGWVPGETLDLRKDGDDLRITTRRKAARTAQALFARLPGGAGSAADALIAERRAEGARE